MSGSGRSVLVESALFGYLGQRAHFRWRRDAALVDLDDRVPLRPRNTLSEEPEGEIAVDRQVGPEREILKDHSDAASLRRKEDPAVSRDHLPGQADHTSIGCEKARDQAQPGSLVRT